MTNSLLVCYNAVGMNKAEYDRNYRLAHPERIKAYQKRWRQSEKGRATLRRYSQEHREYLNAGERRRSQEVRKEVLTHYGNGKLACIRCGFDNILALSIDHIDGRGAEHRRELKGGKVIYRWLKKQGYPRGYQTLCMNCQWIKKGEED